MNDAEFEQHLRKDHGWNNWPLGPPPPPEWRDTHERAHVSYRGAEHKVPHYHLESGSIVYDLHEQPAVHEERSFVRLHVRMLNGDVYHFDLDADKGTWYWSAYDSIQRLIIKPNGGMRANDGVFQPRYELPAINVAWVQVTRETAT